LELVLIIVVLGVVAVLALTRSAATSLGEPGTQRPRNK
jgi:hypothetical protein